MSAADDYVRRSDLERVDRAVDGLRDLLRDVERRQSDVRDADNRAHAAEHEALKERIQREREAHEGEHEREEELRGLRARQLDQKKDRSWAKVVTLAAALAGAASAWVAILGYLRAR